jgi:hypothetical protein
LVDFKSYRKRRFSFIEEVKTIEHSYPKIQFKKNTFTYFLHKQRSRLKVCRKTVVRLVNARLPDSQAVALFYDQNVHRDRLSIIVDKKWGNQLYSKKGIGSWLNIAHFLKQHFEMVDMEAVKRVMLLKPRSEKTSENVFTEKNKILQALFVYLVCNKAVVAKKLTGGFKVLLSDKPTSLLQNQLKLLANEKERLRSITKKEAVTLQRDTLVEIYLLRKMAELDEGDSIKEIDISHNRRGNRNQERFVSYFDWDNSELHGYGITMTSNNLSPIVQRRKRRLITIKPQTLKSLDAVSEVDNQFVGKHYLSRIDTSYSSWNFCEKSKYVEFSGFDTLSRRGEDQFEAFHDKRQEQDIRNSISSRA